MSQEPARTLAASIMLLALRDLFSQPMVSKDYSRNQENENNKYIAHAFFFHRQKAHAIPCNLQFCCAVLNLRPEAVRESVRKKTLNPEAMKQLIKVHRT